MFDSPFVRFVALVAALGFAPTVVSAVDAAPARSTFSTFSASSGASRAFSNGFAELGALPEIVPETAGSAQFADFADFAEVADSSRFADSPQTAPTLDAAALAPSKFSLDADDPLLDLTPRAETGGSTGTLGSNGSFAFSQDVIVRGSVNLPSIKSFQFWGNGYFGDGKLRPDGYDESDKIKEKLGGAQIGANLPLGIGTLSAFYNYQSSRLRYARFGSKQKTNAVGASAFMSLGGFYFTLLGNYGKDKHFIDGTGTAVVAVAPDSATEGEIDPNAEGGAEAGAEAVPTTRTVAAYRSLKLKGRQATGYFETGYEMRTLGLFVLKPFGGYQYSYLEHEDFDFYSLERRDGKRNYDACYSTLGSRIDVNLGGLDSFTLQGRAAWVSQLRSKTESMQNFCFGRVPGTLAPSRAYYTDQATARNAFWLGTGLRLSLMGMFSVSGDYDCLVSNDETSHIGSMGLLIGF